MVVSILAFIFVLGLLVTTHEFGHFLVARFFGVYVIDFSIGYGPKLVGWKMLGTDFYLRALPLGGFVRLAGMEGNAIEGYEEAQVPSAKRFDSKPIWQRSLIVAAGPLMNILLAVVLVIIVFSFSGVPIGNLTVMEVVPDSPAAQAGIQAGDTIVEVNGNPADNLDRVINIISSSPDQPVELTIRRGEEQLTISVIPQWNEEEKRALIGIMFGVENVSLGFGGTIVQGFKTVGNWFIMSIVGLLYTISGRLPLELAGPLGIAQMAGQAASFGFLNLLMFAAVVSNFLAIFNLIPIPLLDGGHLLLFLIEKIRKKPLEPEKIGIMYFIGIVLIFGVAIFVTYQDVLRIVSGK
ncbi:MAG: regulator of sigma protease [Candidatus Atribacteria bacterium]|nr:regulator of sigma protease [Candidatus Atribacteria bacterium]